jgi:hypothetical protein
LTITVEVPYIQNGITKTVELPLLPHNYGNDLICDDCGYEFVPPTVVEKAGSYGFEHDDDSGTYISNNKGVGDSSAIATITANGNCTITINWTVSSETNYDKLFIYVNDAVDSNVNGKSGSTSGTLTLNLNAGDVVKFEYKKNGSGNSNNDCATFTYTLT